MTPEAIELAATDDYDELTNEQIVAVIAAHNGALGWGDEEPDGPSTRLAQRFYRLGQQVERAKHSPRSTPDPLPPLPARPDTP